MQWCLVILVRFHSFIHLLPLALFTSHSCAGADPICQQANSRVHTGPVASSSKGRMNRQTVSFTHTFTTMLNLESPIIAWSILEVGGSRRTQGGPPQTGCIVASCILIELSLMSYLYTHGPCDLLGRCGATFCSHICASQACNCVNKGRFCPLQMLFMHCSVLFDKESSSRPQTRR